MTKTRIALIVLILNVLVLAVQAQTEVLVDIGLGRESAGEAFDREIVFATKYVGIGDHISALERFQHAERIQPNNPALIYNIAVLLARLGRITEAQAKLDVYSRLYPTGLEADRVRILETDLQFERELQKSQQLSQDYIESFNRAVFTYDKGYYAAALQLFEAAERQRPEDTSAVYNQAIVLEAMGEYARATEKLRKYLAVSNDTALKAEIDQRIFALESELTDNRSSIVCAFCGYKLQGSSHFCPRCWHGMFAGANLAAFNTRVCGEGASAIRSTLFESERVRSNEELPCILQEGSLVASLKYSRARQRAIRAAREKEGWTYEGEMLLSYKDADGNEVRLVQGAETLEVLQSVSTGDVLSFRGHQGRSGWFLDEEQFVVDGIKYSKKYTWGDEERITEERVRYQNQTSCGHMIEERASLQYEASRLSGATITGGYVGWSPEGRPKVEWTGEIKFTYDSEGRLSRQEFNLLSATKTWEKRPGGAWREFTELTYPGMRVKKPFDLLRRPDVCVTWSSRVVGNPIDLRGFRTISPDLAMLIPQGVVKVGVTTSYPSGFTLK